ncbi:hypothetical protein FB45DRAFT_1000375 [Roridomyces roridus]|uniref:DUF7918 domain-containing protein n=1 Tax=Roridomyces roridus TaxID=1738132 RepID=A0AAD7C8S2_9AGAR|nr:hypothetical protein FB45DRAFT_1000375 [Roridomyces roridus]
MPKYGPFTAWIEIDGVHPAREYQISARSGQSLFVDCFIASQIGQTFSVVWRNSGWDHPTAAHVFVDGQDSGGRVLKGAPGLCARHEGVTDRTTVRRFQFAAVKVVDDYAPLRSPPPSRLGTIQLAIFPIDIIDLGYTPTLATNSLPNVEIHPDSREGYDASVVQQVRLGEPKRLPAQPIVSHRFLGPPLVTFVFQYRSLDVLQAMGVAPCVPTIAFTLRPSGSSLIQGQGHLKRKACSDEEEVHPSSNGQGHKHAHADYTENANLPDTGAEIRVLREKLNALELRRASANESSKKARIGPAPVSIESENVPPAPAPQNGVQLHLGA